VSDIQINPCGESERTCGLALGALAPGEAAAARLHVAGCADCRREFESLQGLVDDLAGWPSDVVSPSPLLQERLEARISAETGRPSPAPSRTGWSAPAWEGVAPGIECQLLATDTDRHRVSMLVRLAPGASYPPHTHAGVEELHLLDGELWIDERKLTPGDYNYGAPGASDERVWSETGCTCLLVTSTDDRLR